VVGFAVDGDGVLDELARVAYDGQESDTGEEAEKGGGLGGIAAWGWGGYSVRRSGSSAGVAILVLLWGE
jgi:hypothetical protein